MMVGGASNAGNLSGSLLHDTTWGKEAEGRLGRPEAQKLTYQRVEQLELTMNPAGDCGGQEEGRCGWHWAETM